MDKITDRELDILRIMWDANEEPLMVYEIVERDKTGESTIYSIQRIVKNLIAKGYVEVAGIGQNKNVIGRKFKPTVSALEIESKQVKSIVDTFRNRNGSVPVSRLIASLLPEDRDSEKTLSELDEIERLIQEQKKKILKEKAEQQNTKKQ